MSAQPDALQKILAEMDNQLQTQQREYEVVEMNLSKLRQNSRLLELSTDDIKESGNKEVWEGIGKSFILKSSDDYLTDLQSQNKDIKEQMNALNKKKDYLTTSIEKTIENLNKFIKK